MTRRRKAQRRLAALEALEPRQLLATIPPAQLPSQRAINLSNPGYSVFASGDENGNESSPTIVVNPRDPDQLVATWTRFDSSNTTTPIVAQAAISNNGGQTWTAFGIGGVLVDPSSNAQTPAPFARTTDVQAAFDADSNLYILSSQHTADNTIGALLLSKFATGGGAPIPLYTNRVLYAWNADQAVKPFLAVDAGVASFTDPDTGVTQSNPASGNVYVAWATVDGNPNNIADFNPNTIRMIASSDGGNSFGSPVIVNDGGNFGAQRNTAPKIAVSQGTADGGVPGGLVTLLYEDFGTNANASPPTSRLRVDRLAGAGVRTLEVGTPGGSIADAGPNNAATTTSFPIGVSGFGAGIGDLDIRLAIQHPNVGDLTITLTSPAGTTITLIDENSGQTGAAMGFGTGAVLFGTQFNDEAGAGRTIANGPAPYIGHFRAVGNLSLFDGQDPNGVWTLQITDRTTTTGQVASLEGATLVISAGTAMGADQTVATTLVRSQQGPGGQVASNAAPLGIGAGAVIASDNTLGSFSFYQGRLYIAYTGRTDSEDNPADNTDIFLITSSNGGVTWSGPARVNDDEATRDGYSEAMAGMTGRPQFQPSIAVDNATGTLVMSWYDARHDAARARVAMYVATSIDGGASFSQTYANTPLRPTDAATGEQFNLAPIPDNQSPGNPNREATVFGFGDRQGLAAHGGRLYAAWSGNENGGSDGKARLDIFLARMTYAAGPRVIEGTMGPVSDALAPDGSPLARSLIVTFDRRVDPSTFTAADVQLLARDALGNPLPAAKQPVVAAVNGVEALDGDSFGATRFRINFHPQDGSNDSIPGTISYAIGPDISDRIRSFTTGIQRGNAMDQDADGIFAEALNDVFDAPRRQNIDGALFAAPFVRDTLPLIVAGPRVTGTRVPGAPDSGDELALNRTVDALDVTFDRDMRASSLTTGDVQRIMGPYGLVTEFQGGRQNGAPIRIADPNVPQAIVAGTTLQASLVVNHVRDFFLDDLDIRLDLDFTDLAGLTAELISPAGTRVTLFAGLADPAGVRRLSGTTLDDEGPTPITHPQAAAPFSGRFRPVQALSAFDGEKLEGIWTLELRSTGAGSGALRGWSLVATPKVAVAITPVYNAPINVASGIVVAGGAVGATSALTVPADGGAFIIHDLNVRLDIDHPDVSQLVVRLRAPDGTVIPLLVNAGRPGAGFKDTVLDDDAIRSIAHPTESVPPYTGSFRLAAGTINALVAGKELQGTWTLEIDNAGTQAAILRAWSLEATPDLVVGPDAWARSFRVTFPRQELSGTYTIDLGADLVSRTGFRMDTDRNAGVDALRQSSGTLVEQAFDSTQVPVLIAPASDADTPTVVSSTIVIGEDFVIQDLDLTLDVTFPNVPDLEAYLVGPDGTRVLLFRGVGNTGTRANFSGTIFDDGPSGPDGLPVTPIDDGGPPFASRFRPQGFLGDFNQGSTISGKGAPVNGPGTYRLEIVNHSTSLSGSLNSWKLTFKRAQPSDGLGESAADRTALDFRIFTMDPTNTLSSSTWTAVGPASIGGQQSSRISGLAVDPSDPSGNTVYVGGASGGIWKTSNFLDPNAQPTWIPLTDFGPTSAINIGAIAVFGRNNDPNQSIIFAATGEGDTGSSGAGILRSTDGGATWVLLDSTNNNLPFGQRDRALVGSSAFALVVDPKPGRNGVIAFAALDSGLWRTEDTGQTWERVIDPGTDGMVTDVTFDPTSGTFDAISNPTGNLQVLYAGVRGQGVFRSDNGGKSWKLVDGGIGRPLLKDAESDLDPPPSIPVRNGTVDPSDQIGGRIVLAKPALVPANEPNAERKNLMYQGWLYAAVVTPGGDNINLYVTKDRGENWTRVQLRNQTLGQTASGPFPANSTLIPTNDIGSTVGTVGDLVLNTQGGYNIAMAVDPTDPEVVYIGAQTNPTIIRVDISGLHDTNAFFLDSRTSDGGQRLRTTTGPVQLKTDAKYDSPSAQFDPRTTPYTNLTRTPLGPNENPLDPDGDATFFVGGVDSKAGTGFANTGFGATWTSFGGAVGGVDQHRMVTFRDPITGHARLIFAYDQGIATGVDNNGVYQTLLGNATVVSGPRDGNLQINQFYYGAVQPSSAAAQLAGALFYGSLQDNGGPDSDPNALNNGNLFWGGPGGDAGGVETDPQGKGTLFQYWWGCCGGNNTDFFRVNGVGRTTGLFNPDDGGNDWPSISGSSNNIAVNPLSGQQLLISSFTGRLYRTQNQGLTWSDIGPIDSKGNPQPLDGKGLRALAYGAPDPAIHGNNVVDDFIYAGSYSGSMYVTADGGRTWRNISAGLSGGAVMDIVTNPTRGSHEAYAVTSGGVFHIADSLAPGAQWENITSNLFNIDHAIFGDPDSSARLLGNLKAIAVDWRYVLPDIDTSRPENVLAHYAAPPANPSDERRTHPAIYVGGDAGVYRAIGLQREVPSDPNSRLVPVWRRFPSAEPDSLATTPLPPGNGGGLPNADVTDLDMALGRIDPTTGRAVAVEGDPNILAAFTYGRGTFAIRLAPVVLPDLLALDPKNPAAPGGSDSGNDNGAPFPPGPPDFRDRLTNVQQPFIAGYSQQSAFGTTVFITLYDMANPLLPVYVGGYNPDDPDATAGLGRTDSVGRFINVDSKGVQTFGVQADLRAQVAAYLAQNPGAPNVPIRLGVQATDQSGTRGNIAILDLVIDVNPPVAPGPVDLQTASDVGFRDDDDLTNRNNSSQYPAPVFDIGSSATPIEANATVQLWRMPINPLTGLPSGPAVRVNTLYNVAPVAGVLAIADINDQDGDGNSDGAIADGTYDYYAIQIDAAGNPSPPTASLRVVIETTAPEDPAPDLTDETDSGRPRTPDALRREQDNITNIVRPSFQGTTAGGNAVEPFAFVELFVNGQAAGSARADAAGEYLIDSEVDLVEGNNDITVRVTDVFGNVSTPPTAALVVTLDTESPGAINPDLEAASDTGSSNADDYTADNAPTFVNRLIGGQPELAEPFALVQIYAQLVVPEGEPPLPPVLVGEGLADAQGNYRVTVGDVVGDTPIGSIPTSLLDGQYIITAAQFDLAGNRGFEITFAAPGTVIIDGTDANSHGSYNVAAGVNEEGWLYIEKGLNNIGPNVANEKTMVVALGAEPTLSDLDNKGSGTAGGAIRRAFERSILAGLGWDLVHVTGTANIDAFLGGQPVTGQVYVGTTLIDVPGVRLADTGILYITTVNETDGDMDDEDLAILNAHGDDILAYTRTGGGLFSHAETALGADVAPYGWLTSIFSGIQVVEHFAFGLTGVELTSEGIAAFPGLTAADLSTGPWHNYFGGDLGQLTPLATALNNQGERVPIVLTGKTSSVTQLIVTIDTEAPGQLAPIDLQDTSDSPLPGQPDYRPGITDKDDRTNVAQPVFDVFGVEAGQTLELLRDDGLGGPFTVVLTINNTPSGTVAVQDPGVDLVSGRTYNYKVRQFDLAGNVGPESQVLAVTFDFTSPAAPSSPDLQDASDSPLPGQPGAIPGDTNRDDRTNALNPAFDVANIEPDGTLMLLRNGVIVSKMFNVPGPTAVIVDDQQGVVPEGTHVYTTVVYDVAGNVSLVSGPLVVTIDRTPPATPTGLDLQASSDSGVDDADDLTRIAAGLRFDVFGIEALATVQLLRDGVVVQTIQKVPGSGILTLTDPGPIPDGEHLYTVRQFDPAGNQSEDSQPLTVTIDTQGPDAAAAPDLIDASDTGADNKDDITAITLRSFPQFDLTDLEAGATVQLLRKPAGAPDSQYQVVASGLAVGTALRLADSVAVPDGKHDYAVRQFDPAGNQNPADSPALTVTIDTRPPQAPSLPDLIDEDDTGANNKDNVTGLTTPRFDLSGLEPGATVHFLRDGVVILTAAAAGPTLRVQDPGAPQGPHIYSAFQVDVAGNQSPIGGGLPVTIDSKGPAGTGRPDLLPGSDSGSSDTDDVTRINEDLAFTVAPAEFGATVQLLRKPAGADDSQYEVVASRVGPGQLVDEGPVVPDGQYSYAARQVDGSGNVGPLSDPLLVTVDTTIDTPGQPDLIDEDDTGADNQDNVTNKTVLRFDLSGLEPGATVQLLRDGKAIVTTAAVGATLQVQDPNAPEGKHEYAVSQVDPAGNSSLVGEALTVTVVTATPAALPAPSLQAASDTGSSSTDGVTRINAGLAFTATGAAAGATVELLRDGIVVASRTGNGVLVDPAEGGPGLADGKYSYTVRQLDAAGNRSPSSPALTVTIDTTAPAAPGRPDLLPGSDSGESDTDDVTSTTNPSFDVSGVEPGATVELLRDGIVVASRIGNGVLVDPGRAPDGQRRYTARQTDLAGNVGPEGAELIVTIDTTVPASPGAPDLLPGSDSGSSDTDGITNAETLEFAVDGVEAANRVQLLRKPAGAPADQYQVVAERTGPGLLVDDAAPEGSFDYAARQVAPAGGTSPAGAATRVVVDRTVPSAPNLTLIDDTGVRGDGRTSTRRPRLGGTTEPGAIVELLDAANNVVAIATAAADGSFVLRPGTNLAGGGHRFRARTSDAAGNAGEEGAELSITLISAPGDLDGDGRTDLAVYRRGRTNSQFRWRNSSTGLTRARAFGRPGDTPVSGDFDGDGRTDLAVYRGGSWVVLRSSDGKQSTTAFGRATDLPAPADYDGDGRTDLAYYQPSAARFVIRRSSDGKTVAVRLGTARLDLPAVADFDGDGKADPAVYRPGTGTWQIAPSGGGANRVVRLGGRGDIPMPADYDGDSKADPAIYRPSTARWVVLRSTTGTTRNARVGAIGDVPLTGDFDGDGRADMATYRPSKALWSILSSSGGGRIQAFGQARVDTALAGPLEHRLPPGASAARVATVRALGAAATPDIGALAAGLSLGRIRRIRSPRSVK